MKKLALISLVFLLVMGLAVTCGAADQAKSSGPQSSMHKHHAGDDGCGCAGHDSHMAMLKKLGLDEKQKEAIRAIHLSSKKEMIRKKADLELAKIDLREILSKDSIDLAAAETAVKKAEGLKSEMKMIHIKAIADIKSNLNADQKKQFREMVGHFMMRHEMMEHGKCGMHGMMDREMMGHCKCRMHGMEKEKKHEQH